MASGVVLAAVAVNLGLSRLRTWAGVTLAMASAMSMMPSRCMSTAMRTAAAGARFAVRDCNRYSVPPLYRELDVLNLPVGVFQPAGRGQQLCVKPGRVGMQIVQ